MSDPKPDLPRPYARYRAADAEEVMLDGQRVLRIPDSGTGGVWSDYLTLGREVLPVPEPTT